MSKNDVTDAGRSSARVCSTRLYRVWWRFARSYAEYQIRPVINRTSIHNRPAQRDNGRWQRALRKRLLCERSAAHWPWLNTGISARQKQGEQNTGWVTKNGTVEQTRPGSTGWVNNEAPLKIFDHWLGRALNLATSSQILSTQMQVPETRVQVFTDSIYNRSWLTRFGTFYSNFFLLFTPNCRVVMDWKVWNWDTKNNWDGDTTLNWSRYLATQRCFDAG